HASQIDCPLARTLTKVLNRRYAGAISLASKATSEADIVALWGRLRDSGQIAAGYWAVMSHRDVTESFKQRVFGEVHMLSHLHGKSIHQLTTRFTEMQHRCNGLEGRLTRSETGRQTAILERDAALAERDSLRARLAEPEAHAQRAAAEGNGDRTMI